MLINDLADTISLNGPWQFLLGSEERWKPINVPGCWEAQGSTMFLDGPARYRRTIEIPAGWGGRRILLEMEAVSYACTVWCNGVAVGQHTGLWTPFVIDLTAAARPGEENQLALEVWKPGERYMMRSSLAGFLPDVATTFGGIWQSARLRAERCALADVSIRADYATGVVHARAQADVHDLALQNLSWRLEVSRDGRMVAANQAALSADGHIEAALPIPDAQPWSPDSPILYSVTLSLLLEEEPAAQASLLTGFRQLSADGSQLLMNEKPVMVRGVLSWGWEPERIAPTYSREQARDEIRRVRALGFNLIKLCLVIPNRSYFEVADEEGVLLWLEFPMWLPAVSAELREQAPREYAEIAQMLSAHPSIVLYSLGCELSQAVDDRLMDQLNSAVRSTVGDVLLCDNSGSGESYGGLDFDFADFTDYHPYYDLHYFEPLLDNWQRDWQVPRPWIFGEFCDSDTFRDHTEIIADNNGRRPWWMTRENPVTTWRGESIAMLEWEERLAQSQPGFSYQEMVEISHRQSFVIRKYTLEALRRRRGMGGYVITGLRDTPISTSGVWDDLNRSKFSPQSFSHINGETILALEVARRRQWRYGGDRPDRIDPHNFWAGARARWYVILHDTGPGFPKGSRFSWSLAGPDGAALACGESLLVRPMEAGIPGQAGIIQVQLPATSAAQELRLTASVAFGSREASNQWPVWVYPRREVLPEGLAVFDPSGLLADMHPSLRGLPDMNAAPHPPGGWKALVATALDEGALAYLRAGGRLLLLQQGEAPLPVRRCPFWREAIKLFPQHPLWQVFPQRGYTDMQFFGLAGDLAFDTLRLAQSLPDCGPIQPVLRRLDAREFHISEYLFEAAVGQGRLVGCALRLQGGAGSQPAGLERNVAGGAMLHALLAYLAG